MCGGDFRREADFRASTRIAFCAPLGVREEGGASAPPRPTPTPRRRLTARLPACSRGRTRTRSQRPDEFHHSKSPPASTKLANELLSLNHVIPPLPSSSASTPANEMCSLKTIAVCTGRPPSSSSSSPAGPPPTLVACFCPAFFLPSKVPSLGAEGGEQRRKSFAGRPAQRASLPVSAPFSPWPRLRRKRKGRGRREGTN